MLHHATFIGQSAKARSKVLETVSLDNSADALSGNYDPGQHLYLTHRYQNRSAVQPNEISLDVKYSVDEDPYPRAPENHESTEHRLACTNGQCRSRARLPYIARTKSQATFRNMVSPNTDSRPPVEFRPKAQT